MLFPTRRVATACQTFMHSRPEAQESSPVPIRTVQYNISSEGSITPEGPSDNAVPGECLQLHIVFFPPQFWPLAKQFWQHTGLGISSRYADKCLGYIITDGSQCPRPELSRPLSKPGNKHYAKKSISNTATSPPSSLKDTEDFEDAHSTYLEERYGRNLPVDAAAVAKRTLRRRIAGVLIRDPHDSLLPTSPIRECPEKVGPSSRGVESVSEDDVWLFPSGMSAIWSAHQLALKVMPSAKSVCFG